MFPFRFANLTFVQIGISHKTFANKALFPSSEMKRKNVNFLINWHQFQNEQNSVSESYDFFWCASRNLFGKCISIIVYVHVFLFDKNLSTSIELIFLHAHF